MTNIQPPDYKLPFWLAGERITQWRDMMKKWWLVADQYVRLPLTTFDVLTCHIRFVDLVAYQRNIDRELWETEAFYRLRVHFALRNAKAAGTPTGMNQILGNLELPLADYVERIPDRDWDMTRVVFQSKPFWPLEQEIRFIVHYYWRTCRRLELVSRTHAKNTVTIASAGLVEQHQYANGNTKKVPIREAGSRVALGAAAHLEHEHKRHANTKKVPIREAGSKISAMLTGCFRQTHYLTAIL